MTKLFLSFSIIIIVLSSCKKPEIVASPDKPTYKLVDGQSGTLDNSAVVAAGGNVLICGADGNDISVLKITQSGARVWQKSFNAGTGSKAMGIVEFDSQFIYVCGTTSRNLGVSQKDILLVKLTATGDTVWTKTFGGSENDEGYNIIKTDDGNLLLAASSTSYTLDSYPDIYLLKVTPNGTVVWSKSYPVNYWTDIPQHIMQTQNGDYVVTGYAYEYFSDPPYMYIVRVNGIGTKLWDERVDKYSSDSPQIGSSAIELSNGNIVAIGTNTHYSSSNSDVLMVELDEQYGMVYNTNIFGQDDVNERATSITQNSDGTYIITGSSSVSNQSADGLLINADGEGNITWQSTLPLNGMGKGIRVIKGANDNNIVIGNYSTNQVFVTETNNWGWFIY